MSLVWKLCPGLACVFPGPTFQRSQPLISVETASIRRPKTGSSSREWVAGRETGPRVVEPSKANSVLMRLIFPVIAAWLFGGLSRRPDDLDNVE